MQGNTGSKWIICRTCLKISGGELVPIFGTENLACQIAEYGSIELNNNKSLPDKICEKCLLLVKAAHKFRLLCQRSEQQLYSLFELNENDTCGFQETLSSKSISQNASSTTTSDNEQHCPRQVRLKSLKIGSSEESQSHEVINLVTEYVLEMVEEEEGENEATMTQHATLLESNDCEYIELSDDRMDFLENASNDNSGSNELGYYTNTQFEILKQPDDGLSSDEPIGKFIYNEANLVQSVECKPLAGAGTETKEILKSLKATTIKQKLAKVEKNVNSVRKIAQKRKSKRPNIKTELTNDVAIKSETTSNYVCSYCGNVYIEKAKLTLHLKIHTKEKPHECEICHKRFTQTPQLARHMNSHTGSRPFKCKFCDASFADPSTRIKHQRIHTHERPYSCEICGKAFSYSNVLKVHLMTHTGEKPFECRFCGKKFAQLHHKKTHERIHT